MIIFLKSEFLFLLIIFPVFFILRRFKIISRFKISLNLVNWNENAFTNKNYTFNFLSFLYKLLLTLAIISLIVSIAEPVIYKTKKNYSDVGASVMFLLDVSPSMAVKDVENTKRINIAKKIIKDFSNIYQGNSLGLSIFAENASLLILPTIDISNFLLRLDSIEIGEQGDGTAMGNALAVAISNISEHVEKSNIVLLTDGENNTGKINPYIVAQILKQKGIKLYIINIGKEGYGTLEYFDQKQNKQYKGKYYTKINESELKELCHTAGGKYISVKSLEDINSFFYDFNSNTNSTYFIKTEKTELYFYFVFISMILIIVSWLIARIIIGIVND
ncbi:MAG: VWA domain-containing protein [Treponema sp.]